MARAPDIDDVGERIGDLVVTVRDAFVTEAIAGKTNGNITDALFFCGMQLARIAGALESAAKETKR